LAGKVFLITIFLFSENAVLNALAFGIIVLEKKGLHDEEDSWPFFTHGKDLLLPCWLTDCEIGPGFINLLIAFSLSKEELVIGSISPVAIPCAISGSKILHLRVKNIPSQEI
jgi:hypothetical protein